MATARKLPSGNWRVNLYVGKDSDGKRKYKSFTAETKKEAEYLASSYAVSKKEKASDLLFGEAVDRYINSKSNTLSVSTVRGYRIIRNNCLSLLENVKLCDITELVLQNWANTAALRYSPKSIRNQYGLITATLLQNRVRIDFNSVLLKPKQKTEYLIPNKEQMSKIIRAVRGRDLEIPVLLALMLGLRQSEIAALEWQDYDGEYIRIHAAVVPNDKNELIYKETNKSYAGTRTLAVPAYLKQKLDEFMEQHSPDERISLYIPSSLSRAFKKLCLKNSLPPFKMHSLRHANASLMLLEGIADKYAMERLGQSTPHMLKNVYQHTFREEQKQVSEKISSAFDSLSE